MRDEEPNLGSYFLLWHLFKIFFLLIEMRESGSASRDFYKIVAEGDSFCKRAKRCLPFTRSMFVKRFGHKGPRLEARPLLMAAI